MTNAPARKLKRWLSGVTLCDEARTSDYHPTAGAHASPARNEVTVIFVAAKNQITRANGFSSN
jgi:hypothetical protein